MDRLIQVTDPRHNILRKYIYDLKGNVIKEILPYGCKYGGSDEDSLGIIYKYNYMNWLVEKREPFTSYEYRLTTYEYDLSGNVIML